MDVKRVKKYRGFDFFEDQLEEIKNLAEEYGITQNAVLMACLDKGLKLPKKKKAKN